MDDLSMALAASGGISETEYFVIDNDLRSISIPSSMKIAGVENDDDINRIPFRMPRYVKDTDLSEFQIRINYTNALGEGDLYMVTDKTVEEDTIIFSWLLDRHAFASKGEITFTVCARLIVDGSLVDKEYNTTIHKLTVLQGLETDKAIPVDVQDHFLDWLQEEADRQLTTIQSKGTEVLASIPADYTELSGEVVDLKSAIGNDEYNADENISVESSDWVDGYYITYSTGNPLANDNYSYVDVPLDESCIRVSGRTNTAPNANIGIAFSDVNKVMIATDRNTNTGSYDYSFDLQKPENAKYLRVSCRTNYKTEFALTITKRLEGLSKQILELSSQVNDWTFAVPYPLKPSYIKRSGQYNGCLSDIKTIEGIDVLYGFAGAQLMRSAISTNLGNPNVIINAPASGTVDFIKKLDDGTLLVGYESVGGYSRVYKGTSEVWDTSTNHFDSTWSEVLVAETAGQRWSMWFGLSIHKNIVFLSEYGTRNSARNAYLSMDYGNTWSKVFTVETDESGAGAHIHDVSYDPYSNMLWIVTGDGYWAQNVYFSYDMGVTWVKNYGVHESPSQFTSIIQLPNCILFTTDNQKHMAVYRCDRQTLSNKPTHITLNEAYVFYDNYNAESPIGTNGCVKYGAGACAYFGWIERADVAKTKSPVIGTKNGYDFYVIWDSGTDFSPVSGNTSYVGIYGVYGVTENGNIGISFVAPESGTTGRHSIIMESPEWA